MTDMPVATPRPYSNDDDAWDAFYRRDRDADGRFVVAVHTTGIYCRPSCAARRPRREHVSFHGSAEAARAAGFRACLRCRPDAVARDRLAVAEAIALLEAAEDAPRLDTLAARVGYAPHHFHRLFKRATGVTPAAYARALRLVRAEKALASETSVTRALYEAGYAGPSRFYADSERRLGMAPGQWRRGGDGVVIAWVILASALGPLLVATTTRGVARIAFDGDLDQLRRLFPSATLQPADADSRLRIAHAIEVTPLPDASLTPAARRTAFIEAVTRAWLASD